MNIFTAVGCVVFKKLSVDERSDRDLHDYVRDFCSIESLEVTVAFNFEASEDQRACQILLETTVRTNSRMFETTLLRDVWRRIRGCTTV